MFESRGINITTINIYLHCPKYNFNFIKILAKKDNVIKSSYSISAFSETHLENQGTLILCTFVLQDGAVCFRILCGFGK